VSPAARALEALLFLSPEPLSRDELARLTEVPVSALDEAVAELAARHGPRSGLELAELPEGLALRTRADLAEVCDRLRERPPDDALSPAALETLAVVAYLEPVSRPDVSRLRGVQADGVISALVDRGLLEEAGRPATGGAMQYRTTRAMHERFGLGSATELPPLERFELSGPEADAVRRRLREAGHLPEDAADGG